MLRSKGHFAAGAAREFAQTGQRRIAAGAQFRHYLPDDPVELIGRFGWRQTGAARHTAGDIRFLHPILM